jgi:hypothetical protein
MRSSRRGWSRRRPADSEPVQAAAGAPRARRLSRSGLADARLWLGLLLLVASMTIGATILSSGKDTVTVWQASRDLSVGAEPTDLVPVEVGRAVAETSYTGPGDPLDGVLGRSVAAGELLPRSALVAATADPRRRVTVPVDPMHAPPGLQAGDVVDVWSTPKDAAGAVTGSEPRLVLADVTVAAASADELGIGGELGIVLDVPHERVPDLVAAVRAGVTDLVAIPISSQGVLP